MGQLTDVFGEPIPEGSMVIPHTEIGTFRNCRRNWYYTSLNGRNLEPRQKDIRLNMGTVWHQMLDAYYTAYRDDPIRAAALAAVTAKVALYDALEEQRKKIQAEDEDQFLDEEFQAKRKEVEELLKALADVYFDWSAYDANPSDHSIKVLHVEQRFIVPIPDPKGLLPVRAYIATKPDLVVEHNGGVWSWDHKLVSKSSTVDNPAHLPIDLQMGLQIWSIREFYRKADPKVKVMGAIYNMARKQAPSNKVKNPIFARHDIHRSQAELDDLAWRVLIDADQMIKAGKYEAYRWHNPQPYGGYCTWGCPIREVCEMLNRKEDVDGYIAQKFVVRESDLFKLLYEEED